MKYAVIWIKIEEPDMLGLNDEEFYWEISIYVDFIEILPEDTPILLGNNIAIVSYIDTNLFHNIITGKYITRILHLCNKSLIDFYSKKQSTIETTIYRSEYVTSKICVENILDLRIALRYLDIPIKNKSFIFSDNKYFVYSYMEPYVKIHKRHIAISFNRFIELICLKIFVPSDINPVDILSKY